MPKRRADSPKGPPPLTLSVAETSDAELVVVGVGASAGGLEAFSQLLNALPANTGMAFVLVQHLAPYHPSALAEILSRATLMPVREVQDHTRIEADHVYVIPPGRCMGIADGCLILEPREVVGQYRVIDHFFRALADKLKGFSPEACLRSVLNRIAEQPINKRADVLPWNAVDQTRDGRCGSAESSSRTICSRSST